MKRRAFLYGAAGSPTAVAGPNAQPGEPPPQSPPNFLFILFDKCRTDAIGAYGLKPVHTPHIDRLAAGGVRFTNCYTPQALCGPARASIITGLYPHAHGLQKNVYPTQGSFTNDLYHEPIPNPFLDPRFRLWDNFPFLMLNAGYETAYIGKWHLGITNPGFFNTWRGFNSGLPPWTGIPHESQYRPDVHTSQAVEFIEQNASRPFLLWVSHYPPHEPCDPPKRFLEYYRGTDCEPAPYYAAVSNLDWNVGRIVAALEKHSLLDNTFVIITTEHGRTWIDRPGTLSGMGIAYDEAARIPLMMRYPRLLPQGAAWKSGVSLVDVMPTILEATGIAAPRVHGRSLIPDLRAGRDEWSRPIVIQNVSQTAISGSYYQERAIRVEKWKLILRSFDLPGDRRADELYDMQADPNETANLYGAAAHRAIIRDLAALLRKWGEESGDRLAVELGRRSEAAQP
jgi:arylsulfatase A-like enzyme